MNSDYSTSPRVRALLAAAFAALGVVSAHAQQTFFHDNNGATAGLGVYNSSNWVTSLTWSSTSAGNVTTVAWNNAASPANDAVFDLATSNVAAPVVNLNGDVNVRNITVQNFNAAITGTTAFSTQGGAATRNLAFASGAVVTVNDNINTTQEVTMRAFNSTDATTNTLNISGGFTKTGAGTLVIAAQSSSGTAGNTATSVTNVTGTLQINQGTLFLNAVGGSTSTATSRTVNVTGATISLATGTFLTWDRPLSWTGNTVPSTGNAALGIIAGTGTVRGDSPTGQGVTASFTGLRPGAIGTVGTLTLSDGSAAGTTGFTFANVGVGGLKFDLGASGTNDVVAFIGTTTPSVALSSLDLTRFEFNLLSGFGAGSSYTLMTGLTSTTGSLGSTLTGLVGGFDATLSLSGGNLILTTAIPEPSAFAALAGLGAVAFAGLRRRRRA